MNSPQHQLSSRWRAAFELAALGVFVIAGSTLTYATWVSLTEPTAVSARGVPSALPEEPLDVAGAATMGRHDARVVIVAFSDFECPYCQQFAQRTFPEIKTKYLDTGLARFVFKHYPLPIHASAQKAAEAAEWQAKRNSAYARMRT